MSSNLVFHPDFNPREDLGMYALNMTRSANGLPLRGAIVSTINIKGTGLNSAGVAGQSFRYSPEAHQKYLSTCRVTGEHALRGGRVLPVQVDPASGRLSQDSGFFILFAATKEDWKNPSDPRWVEEILDKVDAVRQRLRLDAIAMPPLGCGHGGLDVAFFSRELKRRTFAARDAGLTIHAFCADKAPEIVESAVSRQGAVLGIHPPGFYRSEELSALRPRTSRRGEETVVWSQTPDESSVVSPVTSASGRVPPKPEGTVYVAGIGSRETPPKVLKQMEVIFEALASDGCVLRSGGARGADDACEKGADAAVKAGKWKHPHPHKEIFLPEAFFQGRRDNGRDTFYQPASEALIALAEKHYRFPDGRPLRPGQHLTGFTLSAMARNGQQAMGENLDSPVSLIVCHTQGGLRKGGTGQALRLSDSDDIKALTGGKAIPVLNLGDPRFRDTPTTVLVEIARDVAVRGVELEKSIRARSPRQKDDDCL